MGNEMRNPRGIDMEATGKRIGYLMKKSGWSAKEISDSMGVTFQAVYKWREGKAIPDMENLYLLSRLLGVRMDDFIVARTDGQKKWTESMCRHLLAYYRCLRQKKVCDSTTR